MKWVLRVEVEASDTVVADGLDLSKTVLRNPRGDTALLQVTKACHWHGDAGVRVCTSILEEPPRSSVAALQGETAASVAELERFEADAAAQLLTNASDAIGKVTPEQRERVAAALLDDVWHGYTRSPYLAALAAAANDDRLADAFERARAKVINEREEQLEAEEARITVEIDTEPGGPR